MLLFWKKKNVRGNFFPTNHNMAAGIIISGGFGGKNPFCLIFYQFGIIALKLRLEMGLLLISYFGMYTICLTLACTILYTSLQQQNPMLTAKCQNLCDLSGLIFK